MVDWSSMDIHVCTLLFGYPNFKASYLLPQDASHAPFPWLYKYLYTLFFYRNQVTSNITSCPNKLKERILLSNLLLIQRHLLPNPSPSTFNQTQNLKMIITNHLPALHQIQVKRMRLNDSTLELSKVRVACLGILYDWYPL